jgi:O-antigen/teichoic acid export membrane protein
MKFERTKNTIRNSIWGMINQIVTIFGKFVITIIMIRILGAKYLGLNSLFTSILLILSLAEMGFGNAVVFYLYKPIVENDVKMICALMNLYKKIYRYIGLCVFVVGCCFIILIPKLVKDEIPKDVNLYILYCIFLLNSVLTYSFFAYKKCLLTAHQRNDITSKISLSLNLVTYFFQIIALVIFENYYLYVIFIPILSILNNIINGIFATKIYHEYKSYGSINKQLIFDIRKRVSGLMIVKLAFVSRNAFDSVILSTFLNLTIVAIYNNYYYIMNSITGILLVFTSAVASGIGNSIASEKKEKNLNDLLIFNFIYMWIAGFCTSCLACLYQPFMRIWVGEDLLFDNYLMLLFVFYFLVTKLGDIQAQYFDTAGLWWHGKWRAVIEATSNLGLNIVLGYYFGVFGIILATIITTLFINFGYTTYLTFKFYFGRGMFDYLLDQIIHIFSILIVTGILYFICFYIPFGKGIINQIFLLLLRFIICVLFSNILFILIYYKSKRFIDARKWIKLRVMKKI